MGLLEVLIQEKENLSSMIVLLRNSLESAPAGNLRISHCGQSVQYYYRPYKSKRKEFKQKEPKQKESKQKELKQIHQRQNVGETEAIYLKHAIEDKKFEQGVYIRKCDEKLVHDLAQRDYDEALLKTLEKRLCYVYKLIDLYEKQEAEHLYEMHMSAGRIWKSNWVRKIYIIPFIIWKRRRWLIPIMSFCHRPTRKSGRRTGSISFREQEQWN